MRKVSENKEFPFLSKSLCYYELLNNNLEDLSRDENLLKNAYIRAKNGESKIYITWHGNYRTDMFELDNLYTFGQYPYSIYRKCSQWRNSYECQKI